MAGLSPHTIVMCEGDVRRMAGETPPEMLTHKDDVLKRQRDRRRLTLSEFEDQAVEAARAGEMYLYGMQVRLDDSAVEIRCEGATRGVKEYRGDQHAGVDNSVQAAQGCRLAAGVSDGADLCTLGTADSPLHSVFIPKGLFVKCARELGHDVASLPSEGGQRYFDWVGGGIRYWDGHRMLPHG